MQAYAPFSPQQAARRLRTREWGVTTKEITREHWKIINERSIMSKKRKIDMAWLQPYPIAAATGEHFLDLGFV
jgi:hypothetical protein